LNVPELEGTEDLIKLVMRINKDRVHYPVDDAGAVLYISFLNAWSFNLPNFMKLVVGIVRSLIVCPMLPFANKAAMYSAFMSCHTMPQILKLLFDFNPNFNPNFRVRIDQNLDTCYKDARVQAK